MSDANVLGTAQAGNDPNGGQTGSAPDSAQGAQSAGTVSAANYGNPGDSGDQDWRSELPEQFRNNPTLAKFDSPEALAQSYIELESMRGRSLVIPDSESSDEVKQEFAQKLIDNVPGVMLKPDFDNPEQSAEFYAVMGRPQEAAQYQVPEIEGVDPEILSGEDTEYFKGIAHDAGLSQAQYKTVVSKMTEEVAARNSMAETEFIKDQQQLRNEWGAAHEPRLRETFEFLMQTDPPEHVKERMEAGLMDADTMRWLYSLSQQFNGGESGQIARQGSTPTPDRLTPTEAQEKMSAILNNKEHAFWNPADPGHQGAKERFVELQRQASIGK